MNLERLQVMKELAEEACPFIFKDAMLELIAALEACQAELAEDKKELYEMRGAMITSSTAMKVAGKKIAASQAEVELMRGLNVGNLEDRRYDRKRLVEMEKKLFASQAEVERLGGELIVVSAIAKVVKENG